MTRIFTLERGGLSDIHLSATPSVSPDDDKPAERSAKWGDRQVKDITNSPYAATSFLRKFFNSSYAA